ncbi:hypothetical protein ACH5RR_024105 [Cinchona calisaya]|uniref:MULE transposase domain-containing protein n=1 Tax=Cinchona calisaya TaxID=153742 RepID=A0ABD2ZHK7_9GENT
MPMRELRQTIDEVYHCEIGRDKAYKTIRKAFNMIKGSAEVQYSFFGESGDNPKFMRFYCCLSPLKNGFKFRCRTLICLDGCHTKGTYPGQMLIAIGMDPNNQWRPTTWVVVEKEAKEQWYWILQLLIADLDA